jgi:hypothetical protein
MHGASTFAVDNADRASQKRWISSGTGTRAALDPRCAFMHQRVGSALPSIGYDTYPQAFPVRVHIRCGEPGRQKNSAIWRCFFRMAM